MTGFEPIPIRPIIYKSNNNEPVTIRDFYLNIIDKTNNEEYNSMLEAVEFNIEKRPIDNYAIEDNIIEGFLKSLINKLTNKINNKLIINVELILNHKFATELCRTILDINIDDDLPYQALRPLLLKIENYSKTNFLKDKLDKKFVFKLWLRDLDINLINPPKNLSLYDIGLEIIEHTITRTINLELEFTYVINQKGDNNG